MAFIDSIDSKIRVDSESEDGLLDVWKYSDNDVIFKLKFWMSEGLLHNNLVKEIWLNETRQLNKLKSVTNAEKYLEVIHDSFIDDDGNYCLTYQTDVETKSLHELLKSIDEKDAVTNILSRNKSHWLSKRKIKSTVSRMLLWKNVLRLVEGIEILHSQDIIHRNINSKSIVYKGCEESNDTEKFLLSGFEKSLDFNKIKKPTFMYENEEIICTTQQDWNDLGILILDLLCMEKDEYKGKLLIKEEKALTQLLDGQSIGYMRLVDKTQLKNLIEESIIELSEIDNSFSPTFYVTSGKFDTEIFSNIRSAIKEYLSNNPDEKYDAHNLTSSDVVDFLKEDLATNPFSIFNEGYGNEYILKGKNLLYKIKEFKNRKFEDWYVSYITDVYETVPDWLGYKESIQIKGDLKFVANAFTLIQNNEFSEENSWRVKLIQFKKEQKYTDSELECLQGLLLSFAIDVAFSETKKFLVNLKPIEEEQLEKNRDLFVDDGHFYYSLEYKKENNDINNKLSASFGLKQPFDRFRNYFNDASKLTESWIVEPANKPAKDLERQERIPIQYLERTKTGYVFSSKEPLERHIYKLSEALLRIYPEDLKGTSSQIERRARIFYLLLNQSSLISSLADPASKFFVTSRNFDVEEALDSLDKSKKEVFESLLKTQPNYFIEGPPGVGKTYLITTYIDYLFQEENSAKVLLSAQSHATVNILCEEVLKKLSKKEFFEDLIVITDFRTDKTDDNEKMTVIQSATAPYISKFKESPMFEKYYSEPTIKKKLNKFLNKSDFKFFNQVLRAANLVFTTSNSSLMEKLVRNNINFDVSIMEECGKTSGIELISPMMVSNKRVLIGDYRQLPAFSEQDIQRIIQNSSNFDMHLIIEQLKNIGFKKGVIFDLDFNARDINNVSKTKHLNNLSEYFSLFRSLCKKAESRKKRGKESFGSMINIQHRMHPEISKVISNTVYDGNLNDDPEKSAFYRAVSPFYFENSKLQDLNKNNALIWIDLPDKNSAINIGKFEDKGVNLKEIDIIRELISKVKVQDNNKYSIRVLSPYTNQVNMVNKSVEKREVNNSFIESLENQELAKTVDSFQGDEADLIIISLVRHNSYQPITTALGFLTDMRRMNVLLSRAKHKMIIIGCFGLFQKWHQIENDAQISGKGYLKEVDKDFLDSFVGMFKDDFELMNNDSIDVEEKSFKNINFVQSKSFLEL